MGPAIGSGPKEIFLSANGGQADLSTGNAGGITINHAATNAITIHGGGISLVPGAAGQGGDLEIVGINGSVNLDGVFNISGPAHGGKFTVSAQNVVLGAGTIIRTDAGNVPAALAGTIRINQLSDSPLNLNNSHLFSRGGAGAIYIDSLGQINQSELGVISVAASDGDLPGVIVFSSRFEEQSAPVALLANLNGTVNASSPLGELAQGTIEFDAAPADVGQFGGNIAVTGSANFIGSVTANGSSVSISTSRAQTTLSVSEIKANSGNVTLSATGSGSKIVILPELEDNQTTISAFTGNVTVTAGSIFVGVTKDLATVSTLTSQSISSESITLSTLADSSGHIRIGGNIESADNISITAHNNGNITRLSEALISVGLGGELLLKADQGNIGTSSNRLRVDTSILKVQSLADYGQNSGVFISSETGTIPHALIISDISVKNGMFSVYQCLSGQKNRASRSQLSSILLSPKVTPPALSTLSTSV